MARLRAFVSLVVVAGSVLVWVGPAHACSCMTLEPGDASAADVVFAGVPTSFVEREDDGSTFDPVDWTFDVRSDQKGEPGDPAVVTTSRTAPSCGVEFKVGAAYQVFAFRGEDGALVTNLCSGNRVLGTSYEVVRSDGSGIEFTTFGDFSFSGEDLDARARQRVTGLMASPTDHSTWLVLDDGRVVPHAPAPHAGDASSLPLASPVVGGAAAVDGVSYWLASADGGVFTFGTAPFLGSAADLPLSAPVVGMAGTPRSDGYWLVGADGGVFTFGTADFFGSTGALTLNRPIVALTPTPTGEGYWVVADDGGVFTFGDAVFAGSAASLPLTSPIVGMAPTPSGQGYWLVAADGGVFAFGDAPFLGSAAGEFEPPVVAIVTP